MASKVYEFSSSPVTTGGHVVSTHQPMSVGLRVGLGALTRSQTIAQDLLTERKSPRFAA